MTKARLKRNLSGFFKHADYFKLFFKMLSGFFKKITEHKVKSGAIALLILLAIYFGRGILFPAANTTSYVTAAATKGTIVISVSGSGQVSASDQVDIKAKDSGDVIYIGAENGQQVAKGKLLLQVDNSDAQKTVEDAKINLDQAKIELEKMQGLQTAVGALRGVKEKALDALTKSYEDGFNTVSNAFLNLPTVMSGLNEIFFSNVLSKNQQNIDWYVDQMSNLGAAAKAVQYKNDVNSLYLSAKEKYDQNFDDYKATSRNSDTASTESLISETYDTIKMIADTVKESVNYIGFVSDTLKNNSVSVPSAITTYQSSLNSYTGTTNTYLLNLLSTKDTIQSGKEALIETDFSIADQEIKVKQAQQTLDEAINKLADYSVYAPFSGTIAEFNFKKGDTISNGATVATLVSNQRIAEITLNEVDIAKVKIGQKANITFDAISDLNIAGTVIDIDTLGTVSQGVVNYGVKIGFDDQDERIKPGMSVSTAIITDVKQDVVMVPNSAVKQQGGIFYVEIMTASSTTPRQQVITEGLSNDTMVEIISGLEVGEEVVTQTITSNATTATQSSSAGGLRIPGLGGGGFGR
mgnify:CR=1 FL=1